MQRTDSSPNRRVAVCHLGRAAYRPTWNLQRTIQDALVQAKRRDADHGEHHVVLTVEHPPVYTLGKSGDRDHLLVRSEDLAADGATFVEIDRGGDITFHGPGQLVVYPILDLGHFFTDVHRYLRTLEDAVIATCADFGVTAGRSDGRTGVWVGPDSRGDERKICAMGIKCSRWVTSHGFALNVSTDLTFFRNIVPCGIPDRGVTSLAAETGRDLSIDEVVPSLIARLAAEFGMDIEEYYGPDAIGYLESRFGTPEPWPGQLSEDKPKRSQRQPTAFDGTPR